VLGSDSDLLEAITLVAADSVIVTDTVHLGPDGMRELTWALEGVDVDLMVSPNLVDVSAPRMTLGQLGDERFIHLQQPQYAEAGKALKAIFDFAVGAVLFALAFPLLVAAVIVIRLTTPGSPFFVQVRIGKDSKQFRIYKLRTMVPDADARLTALLEEQGTGDSPLFKVANDPRITPVGRILRRYSIDELPQLVNVLKGEMSLVGPRPHRAEEV
jgi:lipopolysaccharide/colanic/teichoic acid biosynthesis glycosyltransferase